MSTFVRKTWSESFVNTYTHTHTQRERERERHTARNTHTFSLSLSLSLSLIFHNIIYTKTSTRVLFRGMPAPSHLSYQQLQSRLAVASASLPPANARTHARKHARTHACKNKFMERRHPPLGTTDKSCSSCNTCNTCTSAKGAFSGRVYVAWACLYVAGARMGSRMMVGRGSERCNKAENSTAASTRSFAASSAAVLASCT